MVVIDDHEAIHDEVEVLDDLVVDDEVLDDDEQAENGNTISIVFYSYLL